MISDMAYHGAPVAAVSMAGVLSPFLWLLQGASSTVIVTNLVFLAPFPIFLFGTYFLGRRLGLSRTASLLLAILWTYNGQRMAQLDHWNMAWGCAFFPWAFMALVRHLEEGVVYWLLLGGLFWGLNLLSGHPQVFFLEGLFFFFWVFLSPGSNPIRRRITAFLSLVLIAVLVASPLILFVGENLSMDGFHFGWNEAERFFHSWTPLNFITLVFPWFFGRDQFDRSASDYWWQYQFTEMQVAFSIVGLFFILLFLLSQSRQRRWVGITALFGLLMALGKFFFFYPLFQSLPVFSWFRDPARYWFLITWAIGLGAAYAWDEWFKGEKLYPRGRKLATGLVLFCALWLAAGWFFLTWGRPLLESTASWAIQHFLLGDTLHNQPLSAYLNRLPEKWSDLALNLDPRQSRIFLPLLFLVALLAAVFNRKRWNLSFQKGLLLVLVFADLMAFRMPLGGSFYNPSDIPQPAYPAPENRSLVLLSQNTSPLPPQYGEMAYPDMNLVFDRPNLVIDANPALPRYSKILADLGWFSWVYKERDPMGFIRQVGTLQMLGVDQIVMDIPLKLPKPFKTIQNRYPFVYHLDSVMPKAYIGITRGKVMEVNPPESKPDILNWSETSLSLKAKGNKPAIWIEPDILIIQKTCLPGWKAVVNGKIANIHREFEVLMSLHLPEGENQIELRYEPVSLRLGFFLCLCFLSVLAGFFLHQFGFLRHTIFAVQSRNARKGKS